MYAEITKEAYRALVDTSIANARVEETELTHKIFYHVHGVQVMVLLNYVDSIEQYYILDINS